MINEGKLRFEMNHARKAYGRELRRLRFVLADYLREVDEMLVKFDEVDEVDRHTHSCPQNFTNIDEAANKMHTARCVYFAIRDATEEPPHAD